MRFVVNSTFFKFREFEEEIQHKLNSLGADTGELMDELLCLLQARGVTSEACEQAKALYADLSRLPFDDVYENYLSHPIRVAASHLLQLEEITFDDIALGLCHNMLELDLPGSNAIRQTHLSLRVRNAIGSLTIDRQREHDWNYLNDFYDGIERDEMSLMLFKTMDKLDNTLWWVSFEIDQHDIDIVRKIVCPRISRTHPSLATYLADLTDYTLTTAAKDRFRTNAA